MKYILSEAWENKNDDDDDDEDDDNDGVDTVMTFNIWPAHPLLLFLPIEKQLQSCNLRKKKEKETQP